MNEYNDKQMTNKMSKIIITVTVIIIFAFVITAIIAIIVSEKNSVNNNNQLQNDNNSYFSDDVQTEEISHENIVDDSTITLNKSYGKVDVVFVDENNQIIANPEKPQLGNNLTPVKYNESSYKFEKTNSDDNSWYNYSNKQWANAVDENGNYFVWIPRFAYKITYYSSSTYTHKVGYSDSRGILAINENDPNTLTRISHNSSGLQETGNHYIVEPAFMNDTLNSYRNGGWSSNIKGFWVAKYEVSIEGENTNSSASQSSNILSDANEVNNTNTINTNVIISNTIKLASKPCVTSWRNIDIGNAYYNSYNFNRGLNSHLMKNTEWGAIAYLAYSKYGSDTYKISNNNSREYITGGSKIESEVYNVNKNETTTQNVYGIYDLSGGASEFVTAFINNSNQYLSSGKTGAGYMLDVISNTQYKTIYSNTQEEQQYNEKNATLNYRANSLKRGDAIFETSNNGYQNTSWNTNSSFYMQYDVPFMIRGGTYADPISAGLFNYSSCNGQANVSEGYRVCLVIE